MDANPVAPALHFTLALTLGCAPAAGPAVAAPVPNALAERDAVWPALVQFRSGPRILSGFLFRPSGPGPFSAIVFNHGSEQMPGTKEGQAAFYVPHGFVVFVPHRRGHGRSSDAGPYLVDAWEKKGRDPVMIVDELVAQVDDVMAAVAYVAALPFVDAKRVAVTGASLGGIESLFAAERGTGIVAAVDCAGAAAMWAGNPWLQERMRLAARSAKVPVFFFQAENDYDTTPSKALYDEMRVAGKSTRVHIFPPNGTTPDEGHGFCAGGPNPPWGNEVLAFLHEAMDAR